MKHEATKDCDGCGKVFKYDLSISGIRKFCSKRCYWDSVKWGVTVKKPIETK